MIFFKKIVYEIKSRIIRTAKMNKYTDKFVKLFQEYRRGKRVNPDVSKFSNDVLSVVRASNIKVFPMFGTLLSIYRDKGFLYADDYDFALQEGGEFSLELINCLEKLGVRLVGYSVVNKAELVELSFDYQGVRIDIFKLFYSGQETYHKCPNFRKERPSIDYGNLTLKQYKSYFQVTYNKIITEFNDSWLLDLPIDCEMIFEKHYGKDWRVPKKSDFIDFESYDFFESKSYNVTGEHVKVLESLVEKKLLNNGC